MPGKVISCWIRPSSCSWDACDLVKEKGWTQVTPVIEQGSRELELLASSLVFMVPSPATRATWWEAYRLEIALVPTSDEDSPQNLHKVYAHHTIKRNFSCVHSCRISRTPGRCSFGSLQPGHLCFQALNWIILCATLILSRGFEIKIYDKLLMFLE